MNIRVTQTISDDIMRKWNMINWAADWFSLYDEDKLIGYAAITNWRGKPWIGPCEIFEEYRGNGYQKILLEARLIYCRERQYKSVITKVRDDNIASMKNCTSVGFLPNSSIGYSYGETYLELKL